MKTTTLISMFTLACALAGCASTPRAAAEASSSSATAQLAGKPFQPVSALMIKNRADGIAESMVINVYDTQRSCEDQGFYDPGDRYLDVAITLAPGARVTPEYVQFVEYQHDGSGHVTATEGFAQVESLNPVRIRIDARADSANQFKGAIEVQRCGGEQ